MTGTHRAERYRWARLPLRFLAAGAVAAAANFASRIALSLVLPYAPAVAVAYLIGMATAFTLNRRFVFTQATQALHRQAAWFVGVNALALLQTLAVSVALADYVLPRCGLTWHAAEIAHLAGIATPMFVSYFAHRHWTFR